MSRHRKWLRDLAAKEELGVFLLFFSRVSVCFLCFLGFQFFFFSRVSGVFCFFF